MDWSTVGAIGAIILTNFGASIGVIKIVTSSLNKRIDELQADIRELRSDAKANVDVVPVGAMVKIFESLPIIEKTK